jgi:parallel beta-helix repeat protein
MLNRADTVFQHACRRPWVRKSALWTSALLLSALLAPANAGTLFVDDTGDGLSGTGSEGDPFRALQTAIDAASDGDIIIVLPGTYEATPTDFVEQLCGNCEEHRTDVRATLGFRVTGKSLHIAGSGTSETTLVTGAGYGIYFEDSRSSVVTGLKITGGVRDPDGAATDAAVVARRSRVTLRDLLIADNTDRADDVVVGIGGVMGREGAELLVVGNTIRNNGWDGVALYRGAVATIVDNEIAEGRGAGVGVTWDSVATVLRNSVSGYWKGIGSFGSSRVVARNNAVHDNLGWGMVVTGTSFMEASNNVVVRNGNCGFALWSDEASCVFTNNIVTENGWRDEWVCPQVGVWMNGDAEDAEITYNDVWGNVAGDYRDMEPLTGADGNISLDPAFVDSLDFRLRAGSPCIDAGNPVSTDPDGGPPDMGVFGGPQSPSESE